jgi:hypothetical protein
LHLSDAILRSIFITIILDHTFLNNMFSLKTFIMSMLVSFGSGLNFMITSNLEMAESLVLIYLL